MQMNLANLDSLKFLIFCHLSLASTIKVYTGDHTICE